MARRVDQSVTFEDAAEAVWPEATEFADECDEIGNAEFYFGFGGPEASGHLCGLARREDPFYHRDTQKAQNPQRNASTSFR